MPDAPTSGLIAHAIQLAIAPVFLMTGIAGLLNVIATRLARVIDRARSFESMWPTLDARARDTVRQEVAILECRRRLCSWSINFSTAAALVLCLVVVALFVDEFFGRNMRWAAGGLFVVALVLLICGLTCFLREVYVATHTTSFDPDRFS